MPRDSNYTDLMKTPLQSSCDIQEKNVLMLLYKKLCGSLILEKVAAEYEEWVNQTHTKQN